MLQVLDIYLRISPTSHVSRRIFDCGLIHPFIYQLCQSKWRNMNADEEEGSERMSETCTSQGVVVVAPTSEQRCRRLLVFNRTFLRLELFSSLRRVLQGF